MNTILILSVILFILSIATAKYKQKNRFRIILDITLLIIFTIVTIIYIGANYFTGNGLNESVLATISLGLEGAGFKEYLPLIFLSLFAFVILFIIAFFYYKHLHKVNQPNPNKIKFFLHNGFLILAFMSHPFFKDINKMYEIINTQQSDDFYDYYEIANPIKIEGIKQKNIVYIYAESLERTYFDEIMFPDLMPNLSSIIKSNGIEFTNIKQVYGTWFTIAGIVSSQCGVPLFTTSHGNSMRGIEKFYPKAICLGDVLKKDGYYLSYVQGARLSFGGKNKFFTTHQFDKLQGYDEFVESLDDTEYQHGWGLYDDITLQRAYEEFESLAQSKDKFALFLLTLDTHHPNGHLSQSCYDNLYLDGSNEILNTAKCSDMLISDFITKIQNSPYAKDTLIVLSSDHLAMRNTASEILDDAFERSNLFVVLDPSNTQYKEIATTGTMFDIASTVLSFIGIHTDLGLGRNLVIKESIYGVFEDFDKQLQQWREYILDFWSFPKLSSFFDINFDNKLIKLSRSDYSFPILIKVNEDNEIQPFFEFDGYVHLYEEFAWMQNGEKFLWIDRCETMNFIFNQTFANEYCLAQGLIGSNFNIEPIEDKKRYDIINFSKNKLLNSEIYNYGYEKIDELRNNKI